MKEQVPGVHTLQKTFQNWTVYVIDTKHFWTRAKQSANASPMLLNWPNPRGSETCRNTLIPDAHLKQAPGFMLWA